VTSMPIDTLQPSTEKTPSAGGNSQVLAFTAGAVVLVAILTALGAWDSPARLLVRDWWVAAFLFCVVCHDVRRRRIPNLLTFPALLAAWLFAGLSAGPLAAAQSFAGSLLLIAVLFLPFAGGGMGAGDLKASAVIGALWGPTVGLCVVIWALLLAAAAALLMLTLRGELTDLLRRWTNSLGVSLATRSPVYFGPAPDSAAAQGLPFGIALGLGAAAFCQFGAPWPLSV